mmetsp:Transcript_126232/g.353542  ORF Transcript_126232/g.353542 Transcript_126232/m.353542 type:complete len:239 (-) Transcript_126232:13-729(-)
MADQGDQAVPGRRAVDLRGLVVGGGQHPRLVRREGRGIQAPKVVLKGDLAAAGGHVEEPADAVRPRRKDLGAVGREHGHVDLRPVALEDGPARPGDGVEDPRRAVRRARDHQGAIRGLPDPQHGAFVAGVRLLARAGAGIETHRGHVVRRCQHLGGVRAVHGSGQRLPVACEDQGRERRRRVRRVPGGRGARVSDAAACVHQASWPHSSSHPSKPWQPAICAERAWRAGVGNKGIRPP